VLVFSGNVIFAPIKLAGFMGTEQWYRHPIVKNTLYTDGIKYVAQKAGAYWLIDEMTFK
jgi:hypothetical protein